ncbi:MAG: prephenate dehydratase [Chloroflexi bacterium]|nr:prephenate dehydratase [Chloroflexota bacterium]
MARRVAYLGPPGTFSEEAALRYDSAAELVPFPNVSAVAAAVSTGMADEGVVAIENSVEGSVTDTLDLLIHESSLSIRWELVLPIEHCLLVKPGVQAHQVKLVFSHPQALAQCRGFLERCFPRVRAMAALSTAAAVEQALASPEPAAAIATRRAATIYGAEVLARGVQDRVANVTRFVVLAQEDHPPTGNDRTSVAFYMAEAEDRPGALVEVLQEFSSRQLNLSKIESRPSKESLGKYFFLVDIEGHREDPLVAQALERVRFRTGKLKVFGSYPRYKSD